MAYKDPEKQKAWRAANPEKVKAINAAYDATHREERKAAAAAWRKANPEKVKTYNAAYSATNREKIQARKAVRHAMQPEQDNARSAAWYAANPEKAKASNAAYQVAHPEVHQAAKARRKAKKLALPATLTTEQWRAILAAYKHRCAYCGKEETKKRRLTQDHVTPLTKGGGTTMGNIVPACKSCNSRKKANLPTNPVKLVLL